MTYETTEDLCRNYIQKQEQTLLYNDFKEKNHDNN